MTITNDPATWPTGDRSWDLARAIAQTEGASIAGSVPDRLNNPGDISDYIREYSALNRLLARFASFRRRIMRPL